MANLAPTTGARAVAPVSQLPVPFCGTPASPFIAALLAPIEMPTDARAARLYANELRREWEDAWSLAYHRYQAADYLRHHCGHAAYAAVIEQRRSKVPEADAERRAFRGLIEAVHALMLVPAPTIGALRLKQKLERLDGGRPAWNAAIAADLAHLGPGPGPRRRRAKL